MKILIAGENRLSISVLRICVADLAVRTEIASTRAAFARMAVTGAYNVIVSFFAEPFLDGSDLARAIPNRSIAFPAIFVLSWSQYEPYIMGIYESGVDQFFALPFDMDRFRARLVQYLQKSAP